MYHPSRGGVRGGRDQFNWDDVKGDKHRENYLGHSVKAPVGRWQKGKDLYWYTKDHGSDGPTKEEIKRIQEEEEDAMKEMLGLAPRRNNRPQGNRLEKREVDELLKKGKSEEEGAPAYIDGERVQGLGFAPAPGQTGGPSGGKRTIDVRTDVSLPAERPFSAEYVKEADRDASQRAFPASEDRATSLGLKNQRDGPASSEDEAVERKKKKEEKRKAREVRREAKRARKEAKKALKEGDKDKDKELSRHRRREDDSKRRPKDTQRKGTKGKGRGRGTDDSESSGEDGVRPSLRPNHKRMADYSSSSDAELSKHRKKYKRSESSEDSTWRRRRQDAERGGKPEVSSTSSDGSGFDRRHETERRDYSPVQTHQKRRRHDSDSELEREPHDGDRQKKQRMENFSSHIKQKRYSSDSDQYVSRDHMYKHRTVERREESHVRRSEKPRRHDSGDEEYENRRTGNLRRKEELSPVRGNGKYTRNNSDSDEHGTPPKAEREPGRTQTMRPHRRGHDSDSV